MQWRLPLIFAILAAMLAASEAPAGSWLTYSNDRYGTTIDYPALFKPQPPPDADDGRTFKSADGARFTVSASYGGIDSSLADYQSFIEQNIASGSTITYRARGGNWFVISGTRGADIFYERHALTHHGEMTEDFVITYPAVLRKIYDPIAARMAKSFRPGSGFQTQ